MEFSNIEQNNSFLSSSSSSSSYLKCLCRICHEEEEEGTTSMESPCACSGTLKFAHRGCIQRWCDEKGSTVCEICLEEFEPDYTVAAPSSTKPHMIDVVITIRGSLEVARLNNELQNPAMGEIASLRQEPEHAECLPVSFLSVSLMFTFLLLLRHISAVIIFGTDHYLTAPSFIFLLRVTGILLPFYLILQLITIIKNAKRHLQLHERDGGWSEDEDIEEQQQTIRCL